MQGTRTADQTSCACQPEGNCSVSVGYAVQGIGHTEGRAQRYEEVPQKLMQAVQIWHRDAPKLEFVLSLGDIIDGRSTQVRAGRCAVETSALAAVRKHSLLVHAGRN